MNVTTKISAALAIAAISAAFMGYSTSANAAAKPLREACFGATAGMVTNCCDTWIRNNGKPQWLYYHGGSCRSNVVCAAGGGNSGIYAIAAVTKKVCYIDGNNNDDGSHGGGTPPGGGGNGPTTHGKP